MIHYIKQDATIPVQPPCVIVHGCNCVGAWGAGFVLPLGKRYPEAKKSFLQCNREGKDKPGNIDLVEISSILKVCNLYSQRYIGKGAILYDALEEGLKKLDSELPKDWTIQMPRIGCGLAGGSWKVVEKIIERTLSNRTVFVCDYNAG